MALCFPAVPRRRLPDCVENLNGLVNEKTFLQLKEHDMQTVSNTHYTRTHSTHLNRDGARQAALAVTGPRAPARVAAAPPA